MKKQGKYARLPGKKKTSGHSKLKKDHPPFICLKIDLAGYTA
jgi:hypothetical protein